MMNFKRYMKSHLAAELRAIICILAAVVVLSIAIGISEQPSGHYEYDPKTGFGYEVPDYESTLFIPVLFMCILAYVLPVLELSFFKKRINLDCAYSLPISRRAMGTVHYLSGLVILFGSYTVSYLINFILLLSRGEGWFDFTPMLAHFFLGLLFGFVMYSFLSFVFNLGNTKGDGIWFMILYTFLFYISAAALMVIFDNNLLIDGEEGLLPWGVINELTETYQYMVEMNTEGRRLFWGDEALVGWFFFWIVIGIASLVGFFISFGKGRMEKTEEISNTFFGFRVLIPVYAASAMLVFEAYNYILIGAVIELAALVGYTIYRRGFHYKKSDIIILASLLIFLII